MPTRHTQTFQITESYRIEWEVQKSTTRKVLVALVLINVPDFSAGWGTPCCE